MILSPRERNSIKGTHQICASVELSLEYQLKKISDICEKIEIELDLPRETWYFISNEFDYNIDFLIGGFSTLIEYYHSWVIQCLIGVRTPNKKINYKAIKRGDINAIDNVLSKYNIGVTEHPEFYSFDFYNSCKSKYLSSMDFLFIGKYHEIFVLNNYIKHNRMMRCYAPKMMLNDTLISVPYIYVHQEGLINKSILKYLLTSSIDVLIDSKDDCYYKDCINKYYSETYFIGEVKIIVINGLEYVKKGETSIGLSIESILETIKEASINMLNVMIDNQKASGTQLEKLSALKCRFQTRKAKTIYNLAEAMKCNNT